MAPLKKHNGKKVILKDGRYIRLLKRGGYEYIQRNNCTGIVIILAVTPRGRVLFTEQYRIPVENQVIEFPAGLVNDQAHKNESINTAARRELLEETGYRAQRIVKVIDGPSGGGTSADIISMVRAVGLKRIGAGGGDATEAITVHEVPLARAEGWLAQQRRKGRLVDPKVYAGLYFLKKYNKIN